MVVSWRSGGRCGARTPVITVQLIPASRMKSIAWTTSLGGTVAMMCCATVAMVFGVPTVMVVAVTMASHTDLPRPRAVASRCILSMACWILVGV
jgi:hypothetical protein